MIALKEKYLLRNHDDAKAFVKTMTTLEGVLKGWTRYQYAFLILGPLADSFPRQPGEWLYFNPNPHRNELVESQVIEWHPKSPSRPSPNTTNSVTRSTSRTKTEV